MKKIICAALCAVMLIFAVSCKKAEEPDELEGRYVFGGISIILPEGFSETEVSGMKMAVHENYPDPSDNISFSEGTDKPSDYIEEEVKKELGAVFGDLSDFRFETKKGDGFDIIAVSFGVSYFGREMKETIYNCFFNGRSVSVTFVSVSGQFDEAFDNAAASIKLVK